MVRSTPLKDGILSKCCFLVVSGRIFRLNAYTTKMKKRILIIGISVPLILIIVAAIVGISQYDENLTHYTIVKDDSKRDIKRMVEVSLNKKLTKKQLESIAKDIFKDGFKRTFISYKIEGESSSAKWATSNFNPDLDIYIIGSTKKEDSIMVQNAKFKTPGELLSAWKAESDIMGAMYSMSRENDIYLFTQFWKDGAIMTDTIKIDGQTFDMGHGEYGKVYDDGSLGFYDYEDNKKFAHLKHIKHLDSVQ